MNAPLRQMVGSGARGEQIHAAAVAGGMLELKRYAAMKALENGAHAPGGMGKARLDLQRTLIELIKDVLGG
jgi:hypothetical protein